MKETTVGRWLRQFEFHAREGRVKGFGLASLVIAFLVVATAVFAEPVRLRCEYLENPLGLDVAAPHLSWQSDSADRVRDSGGQQ